MISHCVEMNPPRHSLKEVLQEIGLWLGLWLLIFQSL